MYLIFLIKSAIFDFSRNKGRSVLTSLGILIGVLSVVLLVAFGLGLKKYIQDQFDSLGTNILRVVPGKILQGGSFRSASSSFGAIRFDEKDLTALRKVSGVKYTIPVVTRSVTVSGGRENKLTDMFATSADFFLGLNFKPTVGKVFNKTEVDKRAKVAVIGPKLAEQLFGNSESAIDRLIKIEGQSFKIIGVLEAKGGGFGGPDLDSYVYLPYKTAQIITNDKKFLAITIKANDEASSAEVKRLAELALLKRYNEDEFSIIQQEELISAISSIFNILNIVLIAIAAISLLVGGIGIMNIMFVTVTERIKEIGIRRALGATKFDILWQFLTEAVVLSLFGGLLGIGLAYLIVLLIQKLFPAYISGESVALALGVSSFIGVVFGVFPAKKAADLSPIEAIRYE